MRREYILLAMPGINNPEVSRGTLIRPPLTLEKELAWYDDAVQKGRLIFAILLNRRNKKGKIIGYRYIGHTELFDVTWPNGTATTGTIIVDKTCLGKRYGTEAKMLLLYEAFRNRGLRKVCSHVKAFNGNSWGHLLACGYQQVGRRKRHHFYDGRFVDDVEFEVFREDWEPIWEKYQATKQLPKLSPEQRAFLKKETKKA